MNTRQARLWNATYTEDRFWPCIDWPKWAQTAFLTEHKSYRDRFNLMFFFLSNGLDPHISLEMVLSCDYINGVWIQGKYDAHTIKDTESLIAKHYNGTLYTGNKSMMNMISGKVEKF